METVYRGITFRSRLEARWAVFYNVLGIAYQYDRERMHPDGIFYPSHFWLPEQRIWVCIKGSIEDGEVIDRSRFEAEAEILSLHMKGKDIYTFFGKLPVVENSVTLDYGDADNDSAHCVFSFPPAEAADTGVDGGFDHFYHWCECPKCGSLDVQHGGRAARNRCDCVPGDKGHNCGSPRLAAAYEVARQAKVENNELLPTPLGYVYMDKAGPFYKIGRTKHLERRPKEIRLALPYPIEKIHVISTLNDVAVERYWHKRFADKRTNGEWFLLTDDDVIEFRSKIWM